MPPNAPIHAPRCSWVCADAHECSDPRPQVLLGLRTAGRLARGRDCGEPRGSRKRGRAGPGEGPADRGEGTQEGLETTERGQRAEPQASGCGRSQGSRRTGWGRRRAQPALQPSRRSQPHPTASFLLEPHLPLLTFLTAILSSENAIWGQYKIHTMMTGGSSRKSFHTVHSNFN